MDAENGPTTGMNLTSSDSEEESNANETSCNNVPLESDEPVSFTCPACSSSFVTRLSLSRHMVYHENDPTFSCTFCPALFYRKEQLSEHISGKHGGAKFSCTLCQRNLSRRDHLLQHYRNVHGINTLPRNSITGGGKTENVNVKSISNNLDTMMETNRSHSNMTSRSSNGVQETLLGESGGPVRSARRVARSSSNKRGGQTVSRSLASIYDNEEAIEESSRAAADYEQRSNVSDSGRDILHGPSSMLEVAVDEQEESNGDAMDEYESEFHYDPEGNLVITGGGGQERSFSLETQGATAAGTSGAVGGKGKLQCSQCSAAFTNHYNLDRHVESHNSTRPHRCTICPDNRGFIRKEHLTKHLSSVHSGMKFTCEYCGKDISRKDHLIRHIKNVHPAEFLGFPDDTLVGSGQDLDMSRGMVISEKTLQSMQPKPKKPYLSCDMCTGTFNLLNELLEHQRTIHSDVRKYSCDHCPKSFKRREHLQKHVVLHTGCKDFSCDTCGKEFPRKDALQDHIRRIHGPDPAEALVEFKCRHCDKRFLNKSNLRRHMDVVHNPATLVAPATEQQTNYNKSSSLGSSTAGPALLPPVPPLVRITQLGLGSPFCGPTSSGLLGTGAAGALQLQSLPGLFFSTSNEESFSCAHCTQVFSLESTFKSHLATHRLK